MIKRNVLKIRQLTGHKIDLVQCKKSVVNELDENHLNRFGSIFNMFSYLNIIHIFKINFKILYLYKK